MRMGKYTEIIKRFFKSCADFVRKIWNHRQGRIGLSLVILLAFIAIFAHVIAPYDPYDVTQRDMKGLPPSAEHLLGTSITTGQDVFSMLIYGTRVSLSVGIVTGISIAVIGAVLGVAAGYLGGFVDMLLMRIVDIMLVIPTLPLTIVITNIFGHSYVVIVFIFVLFGWQSLARVVRSQVLLLKNSDYVKAAELAGAGKKYIMFRHILPGVSHLVVMSTALTCAGIMIAEAGLSFLGLGNPTAISWGKMLADAQSGGSMLFGHWWTIIAPGIGIFLSVYAFMRLGLAIEEILNPAVCRRNQVGKSFNSMGRKQKRVVPRAVRCLNGQYLEEVFHSMEEAENQGLVIDE